MYIQSSSNSDQLKPQPQPIRKGQLGEALKAIKLLNSYRGNNNNSKILLSEVASPISVISYKARVTSFKDSDQESTKTSKNSLPMIPITPSSVKQPLDSVRSRTNLSIVSQVSPMKPPTIKKSTFSNAPPTQPAPNTTAHSQLQKNSNTIQCIFGKMRKRKIGVSAKSFIVLDANLNKTVCQRKSNRRYEIASLTKIMTFYAALQTLRRLNIEPPRLHIKVTRHASEVIGTSAELRQNDILPLSDLFYGLMLPSGNDAALLIAQAIGTLLCFKERNKRTNYQLLDIETFSAEGLYYNPDLKGHEDPIDYFIQEMNSQADFLGLSNTQFASVHGLANRDNYSCCSDLAKLSLSCLGDQTFREVIACKEYRAQGLHKVYSWRNTNKLLDKGFIGIKTGVTDIAGPCLASCFKEQNEYYIIIVLHCKTMGSRFDETITLLQHARKKLLEGPESKVQSKTES